MSMFRMKWDNLTTFDKALNGCREKYGCATKRNADNVEIFTLENGEEIRETLENNGGIYAGTIAF